MKISSCIVEISSTEQNTIWKNATSPTFLGGEFKTRGPKYNLGSDPYKQGLITFDSPCSESCRNDMGRVFDGKQLRLDLITIEILQ